MSRKLNTNDQRPATKHYRCKYHPERSPAVMNPYKEGLCWECLLGKAAFKKKFGDFAEAFYEPGGPGYAGLKGD